MRREIPVGVAVAVILVALVVVAGLFYFFWQRQAGLPPEVREQIEAGKVPPIRRMQPIQKQ
ncbi:MAG: hypothetical protein NZ959_12275 [Armatimonadetes bacterium]|nr:hypothetical protein [Armatimonadota bacterium]MDW8123054.1 hypothetical protein [Armatimonadota bacterium]